MPALDEATIGLTAQAGYPGTLYALAVDLENQQAFVGGSEREVLTYDLDPEKRSGDKLPDPTTWTGHENYVSAAALVGEPAEPTLVTGSYDRTLIWWDRQQGAPAKRLPAHEGWIRSLVALPDGQLASCGDDMLVKIWEAGSGKLVRTLEGHAQQTPQGHVMALYALALSPDGQHLASADRVGEVRVWDWAAGKLEHVFQAPTFYTYDPRQRKRSIGGIRCLAFSPDGTRLALGGMGQVGNVDGLAGPVRMELWDWQQDRVLAADEDDHKGMLTGISFLPNAEWVIASGGGSDNALLAAWKIDPLPEVPEPSEEADGKKPKPPELPLVKHKFDGGPQNQWLAPDGQTLYVAGYRKFQIFDLAKT